MKVTYIAVLRGINVSGKNMIRMPELKSACEKEGFSDVLTYIQSGNIIFCHETVKEEVLAEKVAGLIRNSFGLEVPVIVRNAVQFEEIASSNPFLDEAGIPEGKLHVTLLSARPGEQRVKILEEVDAGTDRFILRGREIYLFCPGGYGNTKLSNTFFENKLKVTATTRNWKTITKLLELSGKH